MLFEPCLKKDGIMSVYRNIDELIGNTPLVELTGVKEALGLSANIYAKLEYLNPAGSAKDRVAKAMLDDAEKNGLISEGATIIEATSGNTGIGLCAVAARRGYRVIIVMPASMSEERKKLMKAYGAELVLTENMTSAIAKAEELRASIKGSFIPSQFDNPANKKAHFETTGKEIYDDLDGQIDFFVAGVGTGGTVSGVGEYLKMKNKNVKVVAVEPYDSAVLSGGKAGAHALQGIGAGFIPKILNTEIYDRIVKVKTEEAFSASRLLARREGFLVGISSGAALHAAISLAKMEENSGKNIVVLLPDTGDRYLTTALFDN